jgi:putative hydrolase of the HAD superfamily
MVKTIFFDLDDTLYPYKDSNSKIKAEIKTIEYFCKHHHKLDLCDMYADFVKIKDHLKEEYADLPTRGDRKFWITEFMRYEKKYDPRLAQAMLEVFWRTSCENATAYYDAELILRYLKKKGYKLGVITNGLKKYQIMRLKATGLYHYFNTITTTSEVGYEKPHPEVFKLALKRAKTQTKDAVMIGDNPRRDIAPANKLDMTTVWLRRGKRYYYPCTGKENADYAIRSFLELCKIF